MRIPALSITRPWSELILRHGKDVENRSWSTPHRGPLLIHGAKSWQGAAVGYAEELGIEGLPWSKADYPTGLLGLVDVVSVCDKATPGRILRDYCLCGPWAAHGQYHWRLANPRPFAEPIPCNGQLGLWRPPGNLLDALADQEWTAGA